MAECAPCRRELGPKVREALDAFDRCFVGQLFRIDNVGPKLTSPKQNTVTLVAELFAALWMGAPGEVFLRIKLDLEQSSKAINGISCLAHVVDIVKNDSPVVHV